tara:strand:- start:4470 stop:4742 length:273 start_codon:yes stop_codon:yes gene_type:complete
MENKFGILVTCEVDDHGDVTVTYDDVKFVKDKIWRYQGVVTSHTIKKDKLNERADYGLTDEVRERGLLPLTFGIGSNLLSLIKSRLLPYP